MIIPNTFQSPNAHVDRAMHLLAGEEYKVLSYAVRHIYGWQDRAARGCSAISLTTFVDGYTTRDGQRYHGTGLNKGTVIRALETLTKFRLLVRVGKATNAGQEWAIGESPDWSGLESSHAARQEENRKRTNKARKTRAAKQQKETSNEEGGLSDSTGNTGGLSDSTGIVPQTASGIVPQTASGIVPQTESKPYQSHIKANIAPDGADSDFDDLGSAQSGIGVDVKEIDAATAAITEDAGTPAEKPLSPGQQKNARRHSLYTALVLAFGLNADRMTKTAASPYWRVAKELDEIDFPASDVMALYEFVDRKRNAEEWSSFTVAALSKYTPDYFASLPQNARAVTPDGEAVEFVPLTEEWDAIAARIHQQQALNTEDQPVTFEDANRMAQLAAQTIRERTRRAQGLEGEAS